jgi:ADP-ribose pyrophosphatase
MAQHNGWQVRNSKYLFQSPWYSLRQDELTLPNGEEITYTLVDHPGYVMIVPLLNDGRVVMERVYRYTLQRTCLECPSGGILGAETFEAAARRELEEETGYRVGKLERLGRFVGSPGISNEEYDLFLATQLTADGVLQRESTEEIGIELIPLQTLAEMVYRGKVNNGPSALGILLASQAVGT